MLQAQLQADPLPEDVCDVALTADAELTVDVALLMPAWLDAALLLAVPIELVVPVVLLTAPWLDVCVLLFDDFELDAGTDVADAALLPGPVPPHCALDMHALAMQQLL